MVRSLDKWKDALLKYIEYDTFGTDSSYVKHMLCDVCKLSHNDVRELGYGYVFDIEEEEG